VPLSAGSTNKKKILHSGVQENVGVVPELTLISTSPVQSGISSGLVAESSSEQLKNIIIHIKSIEDLIKQRRRWYRGMIQVLDKHKNMYFNRSYGLVGLLGIPNLWFDTIAPFLNIGFLLVTLLTWLFTGEFSFSIFGIFVFLGFSLTLGVIGLSLEPKPEKRNYLALPLLLFYNMFLDGIRIMSLTEEMVNILMDWEKPKR